jgi:hypothetical protein
MSSSSYKQPEKPTILSKITLSDNDKYKVDQTNQNISEPEFKFDVSPSLKGYAGAVGGDGGDGGTGGSQSASSGQAETGSTGTESNSSGANGGSANATSNGGGAAIGDSDSSNTSGSARTGNVAVGLVTGSALTGDAHNGNSTTGGSNGGASSLSSTTLSAGDARSGEGGNGGTVTSGNSQGGSGGGANTDGGTVIGVGESTIHANAGEAQSNGGTSAQTGQATSEGATSATAAAGNVFAPPITSTGAEGGQSGQVQNAPHSAGAESGTATTNQPVNSGEAFGGEARNNTLRPDARSEGGLADAGDGRGLSYGGPANASSDADANSLGQVIGNALGGDAGDGAKGWLDFDQSVAPITVVPVIHMPMDQHNKSNIDDGQEYPADWFGGLKHAGITPSELHLSDDDSYDVAQGNYLVASPTLSVTASPEIYGDAYAKGGNGGNGGNGGSQTANAGGAKTGNTTATSNAGVATGGHADATSNGGNASIGNSSNNNTGGNAASGDVVLAFATGAAASGSAWNGDSTTGTSTGGSSTMSGNQLLAGDATTGNGGDGGNATTGDSIGGNGGNASAQGGNGGGGGVDIPVIASAEANIDMQGGHSFANGANASPTGNVNSQGASSGFADGGDVSTPLTSTAGKGVATGNVDNDPESGFAKSGLATNNAPINTAQAHGADAHDNVVTPTAVSLGHDALAGDAYALSQGGNSYAWNDADATSLAQVLGYADGGHGGAGATGTVDFDQHIAPITIAPVIDMPYVQANYSDIQDGNEFQAHSLHH